MCADLAIPRSNIPEYRIWKGIKARCYCTTNQDYRFYGEIGVTVYEPWRNDFDAFFLCVGKRPTSRHTLDRWPNPAGNYEPGNVRWATRLEQGRNKRNTQLFTHAGKTQSLTAWAVDLHLSYFTLRSRLRYGWTIEQLLTEARGGVRRIGRKWNGKPVVPLDVRRQVQLLRASGSTLKQLSEQFGISPPHIVFICRENLESGGTEEEPRVCIQI